MTQAGNRKPSDVTLAEVRAKVDQAAKSPHPRLFTAFDGETLRRKMAADPALADYFKVILAAADKSLAVPVAERKMTGRRLLHVSRAVLDRITALGLAWRVTGERKYADRAIAEARQVCRFSDWNPSHFLDVGEMSLAVALCLDWFDAALTPDVRDELVRGLIKNGLDASDIKPGWWVSAVNNWGQVCHGGMIAAALVVMDREPEMAARVIHRAVINVPISMAVYAPDGGYPEGPGYWHYGTIYNVILIECLESGLGTDFGLSALPGFDKTGDYIQVVAGPAFDNFNYADGGASKRASTLVYWFANRFGSAVNPAGSAALEAGWRLQARGEGAKSPVRQDRATLEFLFATLKNETSGKGAPLPLDWQDRGDVPIAIHRGSWAADALYVGVKAGSPGANHGQMDSGSFVLDAGGVRWAVDLGAEDYQRIEERGMNLWDKKQESDRWRVFRLSSASHNTLMIDGRQQHVAGKALITAFSADPATPFTVVDMTPNYVGQATKVIRTVTLPGRKRAEIRDALAGLKPGGKVRWGMVTCAAITLRDGEAVLKQGGKMLTLTVSGSVKPVWKIYDTATPPAEFDSPNPGTAMIGFEAQAPASGELEFTVTLTPG